MKQEGTKLKLDKEEKEEQVIGFDNGIYQKSLLHNFFRLENLNTLAVLCLRGNGITVPPKDALASLQSLQHLRMDDNNITVIGKDAFGTMRVISSLSLSNNKVPK